MNTTTQPRPTVRVRWDVVAALRELRGLESDAALAAAMGVHQSNLSRVTNGKQQPGPTFMAALCLALDAKLNNLFEVVPDQGSAA